MSVSSLGLSGSPMHGTAPLTGKSGLSNVFAGVLEPSRTLCMCMHTLCVPGQLSSPSVLPEHGLMFKAGRSFLVLTHSEHDQGVIPMSS